MTMQKKLVFTVIISLVIVSLACHRPSSPANSSSPSAQQVALIDDLRKLAATQCGIREQAVDVNSPLQKQGCDDLDLVELVMTIEEKYNVTIPDADTDGATVNSLARIVNKR